MGVQVISFSRAFLREKDFRPVDRVESRVKKNRQQNLNSKKDLLMKNFELMIQHEDYCPGFLFQDIWQLYLDTVEGFGIKEAIKAIQKAKNRFVGQREVRKLIRGTETLIQNYHDFRESYIISGVASRQTALEFLFLCNNCGSEKTVILEVFNFLNKKKDFLMLDICRGFFVAFFEPKKLTSVGKNFGAERVWENFQSQCLNGTAEELALRFMVLCATDSRKASDAIDLLKQINRESLADICDKAVESIRKAAVARKK